MKKGVIYESTMNDREWRLTGGVLYTRIKGGVFRRTGWPEPEMSVKDIDHYIEIGQMQEQQA